MSKNTFTRRRFIDTVSAGALVSILPATIVKAVTSTDKQVDITTTTGSEAPLTWQAGISSRVITPSTDVWLAGYGTKRAAEGKIHELYAKVMALKSNKDRQVVMITTDSQGMSKTIYESLCEKLNKRFKLERDQVMLTFSHNHSGPCLKDDLVDYYPSDDKQKALVAEYSDWLVDEISEAVGDALKNSVPAKLYKGEGNCNFAVNRRENVEAEVTKLPDENRQLNGVVDHYVPVLAIRDKDEKLIAALFGYACHPTTLSINLWSGDYPGYAQINLEASHPGMTAMFFNACGADQNPLPRRKIELCEKYGKMLSDAVEQVLAKPMQPVSSGLESAFKFVNLDFEKVCTREDLVPIAKGESELHARWASRMIRKLDAGEVFQKSAPYPVQGWLLGKELLLIGIGGETVVDYSLKFKRSYPEQTTWVCGYANYMVAYIPSRRVWEEGGYEGGSHLDEYGHPAWRWAGDVEDRITDTVKTVVNKITG